jgi:hypothetical protein
MAPIETVEFINAMTDDEFERYALGIVHRELGVYGLARFIRVYRSGAGDYTRDRHQWLDGVKVEDVVAQLQ